MDVYKHLLIATDGSELAQKAFDQGLDLAKAINARATVIYVTPSWASIISGRLAFTFPPETYNKAVAEEASEILSKVEDAAKKAAITCDAMHVID